MAKKKRDRTDELLAELVKGKSPEEILGQGGILKQLTKRLVENALEGEMTEHLGYEPHAPEGNNTGNSRNGMGEKDNSHRHRLGGNQRSEGSCGHIRSEARAKAPASAGRIR